MDTPEKTISELAAAYGVSLRALRFYEDRGLLQPIRRGSGRFYTAKDSIRLQLILKGKRLGFTLAEIQELINSATTLKLDETDAEVPSLTAVLKPDDILRRIEVLEAQRSSLECAIVELRAKIA